MQDSEEVTRGDKRYCILMNVGGQGQPGRGRALRPAWWADRQREIAVTDQWPTNLEKEWIK